MPVTQYITDGIPDCSYLDCFRAAQRSKLPMAGRLALRGRLGSNDNWESAEVTYKFC